MPGARTRNSTGFPAGACRFAVTNRGPRVTTASSGRNRKARRPASHGCVTTAARLRAATLPILAIGVIYGVSIYLLQSAAVARDPDLMSAAIATDLVVTASLAVWWLGVRRAGWPRWTIGATAGVGLLVARTSLPSTFVVTLAIGAWMIVEVALVAIAIAKLRTIARVARAHDGAGPVDAVVAGLRAARVPARMAELVATDVVAIWFGVTGWFRRPAGERLTMHRSTGWTAILGVLLALVPVETALVHLVVTSWSVVAAWIVTALSIYSALWLAGHLHLVRIYGARLTTDALHVVVGLRWRFSIPRSAIVGIERVRATPAGAFDASLIEPTLAITLDQPIEIRGLFGIRKRASTIALTVDEPDRLIEALR
jgi:hypothetical protein